MSFASTRTAVAAALTVALTSVEVVVYPSRPVPFRNGVAWLVLTLADSEELTYTEVARVTYDVVLALGSDDLLAESELDRIAGPLMVAMNKVGRGATIRPLTLAIDGSDIYCAAGTLITEVGTI